MNICSLHRGTLPLLVSLPHDGSHIPDEFATRMVATARRAPDTDWFVSRLYEFAIAMGASVLVPTHSRYVVDLNRPEDDVSLYPGQNTTGLCPIVQFTGEPVYLAGAEPTSAEIAARVDRYWRPYHDALGEELTRLHAEHGRVLLWEGHSIRSRVPFLFEGQLPDFNLGTANGSSCLPGTQEGSSPCYRRRNPTRGSLMADSRAVTSPAITAGRKTESRPCSWNSRSATTWTRTRSSTCRNVRTLSQH